MFRRRRVALIVEMSGTYGRQILEGVAQYLRSHRPWSVFLEQRELRAPPPPWFLRLPWDGVICRSTTYPLARAILRRGIPTVDLNDLYGQTGLPRIISDMRAIGRMGAEYFLQRGFRHFGFCGFSGETWSRLRCEGFATAVYQAGYSCAIYESPWRGRHTPEWHKDQRQIAAWLRSLRKPTAVMTCNDVRGQQVLNACWDAGIRVPEEVAVLGVDNEEFLCELCNPPLSSVVPNAVRIGYEAAELLDQLMDGKPMAPEERLIQPLHIVTRQSSDILAIEDPDVAAALAFIREHACHGLTADAVANHVAISRSVLERRFRKYLNSTPHLEIRRVQIARIKQLLLDTDLPLDKIASLAGYEHPEYMSVVFKRMTGMTPGKFRRLAQTAST